MNKLFAYRTLPVYIFSIISISYGSDDLAYISPGIQIGFDGMYYYGFQLSVGYIDNTRSQTSFSPSICYGYKKYFPINRRHLKNRENFIDLQILSHNAIDPYDSFFEKTPFGFGLGKIYSKNKSTFRIKSYVCLFNCFTYDYEIKNNKHSYSLIPVLPIPLK